MPKKKNLPNFLLAITVICLALVIAEVCLYSPVSYRRPSKQLTDQTWSELLHRPSSIPGLAYELVPNRKKYSHGAIIKTNSFGMRDDEPSTKTDTQLTRIAVIGDSFTFGFGVRGEHTYPNVLERLLNNETNDRRFEVLNFGVGGYSIRDVALIFKHKVIDWDLALVIIGYVFNDPEIDPIQPLHSYYDEAKWWQRSSILRLVALAKRRWDLKKYGAGDYYRYLHATSGQKWQSVVTSLEEIKIVADKKKIPVLLVVFPDTRDRPWTDYPYQDLHHQVTDTTIEKGIYVKDLYEDFSQYSGRTLMAGPDDGHPSQLGHEVAASAIYQWIVTNQEKMIVTRTRN